MPKLWKCSLFAFATVGMTFGQSAAPGRGTPVPVGQAQARPTGVAGVKVILGKPGGNSITLTPSPDGSIAGSGEGRFAPGARIVLLDGKGAVVSAAVVNAANGSFTLPAPRVPIEESFSACLQSPGAAQVCSDAGALRGLSAPRARAAFSPAESAVLANIQIVKVANGWKCVSAGGKACSDSDVRLMGTTITKSRSNVKDNLIISPAGPDGLLRCFRASDNKPCSDAEIQDYATQVKAIQQEAVRAAAPGQVVGK